MRACVLWMASNRPIAKTTSSSLGAYTHAPPVSFPVFRLSPPLLTSHPSSSGFFVSVTFLSFVFPYDRSVDGWLSVWRGPTVVTVVLELPPLFFFFVLEQHPFFFFFFSLLFFLFCSVWPFFLVLAAVAVVVTQFCAFFVLV